MNKILISDQFIGTGFKTLKYLKDNHDVAFACIVGLSQRRLMIIMKENYYFKNGFIPIIESEFKTKVTPFSNVLEFKLCRSHHKLTPLFEFSNDSDLTCSKCRMNKCQSRNVKNKILITMPELKCYGLQEDL
jgi:hypothetical protein